MTNNKSVPAFSDSELVLLKDSEWLQHQRIAGKTVGACLKRSKNLIEQETYNLSLLDLEAECAQIIDEANCTPTFFGYKGFPGKICASVNNQLVHGIPSSYQLQPGDVVKIDLGATYQGAIADAAITVIYGKPKSIEHIQLLNACQNALTEAIKQVAVGKRLGVIGNAIHHATKNTRFGLITNYGGHGLDLDRPHAEPFVANKAQAQTGIRLQSGLTLAIEPMLVIGDTKTWTASDGWTVYTQGINAHFEHTIFLTDQGPEILTAWN